jgi:hypothetical protein
MGKSSVFAAWERAYFRADEVPNLSAAVRRFGFILIALPVRRYAALPAPDSSRPESWVLETVRRQLEQFGFATRDLGLIEAMLRAGHIALMLDGTNEADRDTALTAFANQFPKTRLLVTSQAIPQSLTGHEQWEQWELPGDIAELRDRLLAIWLGDEKGAVLASRIVENNLSGTIVSGYDLRLLADLAAADPENAPLPDDRVKLYRTMLERAKGPEGETLRPERLEELAWTMVMEQRRRIVQDDEKMLDAGTLREVAKEGLRILRPIAGGYEFRHDQMRAFLAALWLVDQKPTLLVRQETAVKDGAFDINERDQEELWGFVALLTSTGHLEALWNFAADDAARRAILQAALQLEARKRNKDLSRAAQRLKPATAGVL